MPEFPTVAILAPSVFLSVTIERGVAEGEDDVHVHAGGQGIWIARMLRHLGERPILCAPLGGESGSAFLGLARTWDLSMDHVQTDNPTPVYVDDRRSGSREQLARTPVPALLRHDVDELYGRILKRSRQAGLCVVTGRFGEDDVPVDLYARLGVDLAALDVPVVGDLHGDELVAFLERGRFAWLKIADRDLRADGRLEDDSDAGALTALRELVRQGADRVALSRGHQPGFAHAAGRTWRVQPPALEAVDTDGAGDSMSAALASAWRRGLDDEDAVRLAWAAGAANVVRRGHGSASVGLVEALAECVVLTELESG